MMKSKVKTLLISYSDNLSECNVNWQAYKEVNNEFATQIKLLMHNSSDLIWVNDLHLLLVPN